GAPGTQALAAAGATLAVGAVRPALAAPGDDVLLLSPYYLNHGMAVQLLGARPVEVPLDPARAFAVDFEALERAATPRARVLVIVNPSNPIGSVLGPDEVSRVLAFAADRGLWVVSDETYEDFVLDPPAGGC